VEEISRSHQETPHWKDIRDEGHPLSPRSQHIAGTGLTSQSMGTPSEQEKERSEIEKLESDKRPLDPQRSGSTRIDEREADKVQKSESISCRDQQSIVGAENQRLPSYEIHQTKDELEQGLEQAASNLRRIC